MTLLHRRLYETVLVSKVLKHVMDKHKTMPTVRMQNEMQTGGEVKMSQVVTDSIFCIEASLEKISAQLNIIGGCVIVLMVITIIIAGTNRK